MKRRPKPKKETTQSNSAGQVLRERLNTLKARGQVSDSSGVKDNNVSAKNYSRLAHTPPRNKSQKTRKGLRPG